MRRELDYLYLVHLGQPIGEPDDWPKEKRVIKLMLDTNVHRLRAFREVASISHAIKINEYIPSKVSGIKGSQTPNPTSLYSLCVH